AVMPAAAHAGATVVADTTRGGLLDDPVALGRAPSLTVGSTKAALRFSVSGLSGAPARAVLRLRVTEPSTQALNVTPSTEPGFAEDGAAQGGLVLFGPAPVASGVPPAAGSWTSFDVTKAVTGNGSVAFEITGSFLDPVSFSSREGPDAPQLLVEPDDATAAALAARLDPRSAPTVRVGAKDDRGRTLDGLDVALSPDPASGRYLGVYHSYLDGRFVAQVATSPDLVTWTHRADLAEHGGQPSLAVTPAGGVVVADEQDTPDPKWVSTSALRIRHYPSVAALFAGQYDAERVILPRTLAPTAEGTPQVSVVRWGTGPADSELRVTFHYYRDVDVDRQAIGMLTNFTTWNAWVDSATNTLLEGFGIRGAIGDRSDIVYGGRPFGVVEGQVVKNDHRTWRLFLVDRSRGHARMVSAKLPGGGYSLGNPAVTVLPGPSGAPVLFASVFAFSEGAPSEAGSAIAVSPLG
ncbi:MAG TPA: hypothetical protein VFZ89_09665, partial [Solirubrobacteraceae bacterium]